MTRFPGATPMLARFAYAFLFAAILPAALVAWAMRLDTLLPPSPRSAALGGAILVTGVGAMVWASADLWRFGEGLPASPFPPKRLVTRGIYGILPHPVYVGAVLATVGASLMAGSGGGLWIVSPVLALSAAAFVFGFERDATRTRYGALPNPRLRLPAAELVAPDAADRVSVYVLVLAPWLVAYEWVLRLGAALDARSTYFAWDAALPVIPWTEGIYASTYLVVLLAPLVAARRKDLRRFAIGGLWATALIMPLYLLLPFVAPLKPVPGDGFWQTLMAWERRVDAPANALPAFHVVWACLAAQLFAARLPRARWLGWSVAAAIAVSCVTTGMHSAVDVVVGFAAFALVARGEQVWRMGCDAAECLANSATEIVIGPARFMSHGIFAGVGAAVGCLIAVTLAGSANAAWIAVMIVAAAVLGAALWAQWVEGSPQLLRPFGYFGGVAGFLLMAFVAHLAGANAWLLLVSCGVGGCFGQAIARMRCLVQGCCHGREAPVALGIRYTHPASRVVRLSALGGTPVHPTQLYSMVWATFVGLVLLRLWSLSAALEFIAGTYFILIGLGRFVEEHFRGEPQTKVIAGLRLYQWLTIAFVIGGAALTTLGPTPAPRPSPLDPAMVPIALAVGVIFYLAYGADLPRSNVRFSRLR